MAEESSTEDKDIMLTSAVAVMAASIACIATVEHVLNLTSSSSADYSSSASSGSTGGTRVLEKEIDHLSAQIGEVIEAIRSREEFSSTLYGEVMKCENYDEMWLGKAFDFLHEHKSRGRAFIAKNNALRQAWLSWFFSNRI